MSYLILDQDLNADWKTRVRLKCATDVVDVVKTTSPGTTDLLYRPITATDWNNGTTTLVGPQAAAPVAAITNPLALATNVYSADCFPTLVLDQSVAWIIYGWEVYSLSPHIQEICFQLGAVTLGIIPITELYAVTSQIRRGYFIDPITYKPKDHPVLRLLADDTVPVNAEMFRPMGFLAEPVQRNESNLPNLLPSGVPGAV